MADINEEPAKFQGKLKPYPHEEHLEVSEYLDIY